MNSGDGTDIETPPERPVMVYDGDCRFCKFWVERWRGATGDAIEYAPYQAVAAQFPSIPLEEFHRAVQLIRPDGSVATGAEAIFAALGHARRRWPWLLRLMEIAPLRAAARIVYRVVARHRSFFSILNRIAFGRGTGPPRYWIARWLFLRVLAVIYLIAFLSLAVQILGLVGRRGILPAAELLEAGQGRLGPERYWRLPTIFWLNPSDGMLLGACIAGIGISVAVSLGYFPATGLLLLWILYLSLINVCQRFLGYQWDILLVETGFLAVFLAASQPGSDRERVSARLARWLMLWLLFRLMFESGVVKLRSGDPAWRDLTALRYHYETQPLPVWTSWYAHWSPPWIHSTSAGMMFAVEFGAAVLIFGPRNLRRLGACAIGGLQTMIAATGNYGFFNFLTIGLCIMLIDDDGWPAPVRKLLPARTVGRSPVWFPFVLAPVFALHAAISAAQLRSMLDREWQAPELLRTAARWTEPFRLVNSYGLFAVMTKSRPEIIIEGSRDGIEWKAYEFKWKPGEVTRRPRFVAPHQPRLDWQMWFAALGTYENNAWLLRFMERLLEGEPQVLALLRDNPFPDGPPRQVRAVLYEYKFSRPEAGGDAWWVRTEQGMYTPVLSLRE